MRLAAALVHLFTGLGVVCAFFALQAATAADWPRMFFWLGAALIIDGIDGTFARLVGVKEQLPRYSGEILDLVVDYLTYVFVPAFALAKAGFLDGWLGEVLVAAILLSSLHHFADSENKAADLSFVGFPAVWNIVAFYIFIFEPGAALTAGVILLCVVLTFVPTKWVHPFRMARLRVPTLAATVLWAVAAIGATWMGLASAPEVYKAVLLVCAAYFAALSLYASLGSA